MPTGRPAASRSETAKLPGNNGRNESAPGLKKALGKVKRPLVGEAEPGKSAVAKLRPRPAARPLGEQPVRAKVAKPKPKPRRLVPLDRGRAPRNSASIPDVDPVRRAREDAPQLEQGGVMRQEPERWALYTGVVAVVLWIVGIFVVESGGVPGENATDADYLAYYQEDANRILSGSWIFMVGCLAFLVFAVVLWGRLAAAEGGSRLFSNVALIGAVATGVLAMLSAGPDVAAAIQEDDLSAAAAGSMQVLGDAFFVGAELSAILLMLGAGMVALRTGVLPKAWAWFSFFLAVVLVIGPIGWAALIFGLPVWVLGTTFFLARRGATAGAEPVAPLGA